MINITNEGYLEVYNIVPVYRGNRVIKYLTSVSMEDINKIYDKLEYDNNTQRGERVVKMKKQIKMERIVNKFNIEEMKYKMKYEFYDGGTLYWNCRIKDVGLENEVCQFYPLENKIVIKTDKLTLPDSSQRHMAIRDLRYYTFTINQKEFCFPLNICLYTLSEEQSLFSEINGCGTKASRTRSMFLSHSYKNILVKEIIKESKLNNNVETVLDQVYGKDKVVAFATLFSSLFDKRFGAYKDMKEDDDVKDFKNYIIKYFNQLIEVRPELGKLSENERLDITKNSIATSSIMWYCYTQIARSIQNDHNWKVILNRLNKPYKVGDWEGDILSLQNPLWHGTICTKNKRGVWKVNNSRRSQDFCMDIMNKHLCLINK
jgi:hypothetical protein